MRIPSALATVVLAFSSMRPHIRMVVRNTVNVLQPYNDTTVSPSDAYLQKIEKKSKLRTNTPSYLDSIEKSKHHRNKRLPAVRKTSVVIPQFGMRPKAQKVSTTIPKSSESGFFTMETDFNYNFTSIGGYESVKNELAQVADMMLYPGNYTQYNVRTVRGILLEGPPGNGKTLLAKCFAGEIKCNFVQCAGSEFNEKYIGVGSSRLRELFKLAKDNQPAVIFLDEVDALCRKRSGDDTSSGERDTTLNQLLVLMDGFKDAGNVLVIGATNRADILDKAMLRPGRFDKIIHIPNPDILTREAIVKIHRKQKPIDVETPEIAKMTGGFSGAMIENLLNEATLWGIRNAKLPVSRDDLDRLRQQMVLGGALNAARNISATIRKRIAVHEVGHMINALLTDYYEKPIRVSIDTSNRMSLGQTLFEKDEVDDGIFIREYLEEKVRVLLGGKAAEELVYGQSSSSGSVGDLEVACQLIKRMILEFGMGNHLIYPFLSEEYKRRIDDDIHAYIHTYYEAAKAVIANNMHVFHIFVDRLLDTGVLTEDDMQEIVEEHKLYAVAYDE